MQLTPIRIRGSRSKAYKALKEAGCLSSGSSSRSSTPSSTPKRKLNDKSGRSRKRRKIPERSLSRLEQLPPELLQSIFFECMNISLPRSSPHIASKLTSEHIFQTYSTTVFMTYSSIESDASGNQAQDEKSQDLSVSQQIEQVQSCKFFDWNFERRLTRRIWKLQGANGEFIDPQKAIENFIGPTYYETPSSLRYLPLQPQFRAPVKLLHGPWTDDKIYFLYFLVLTADMYIDWDSTTAGEVATEGLFEAIREHKEVPVACLLSGIRKGVSATTEMLRVAVMEAACNRVIVNHLILKDLHEFKWASRRNGTGFDDMLLEKIDFTDPILLVWATEQERNGNPDGAWLRSRLQKADSLKVSHIRDASLLTSEFVGDPKSVQYGLVRLGTNFSHGL